jgi:ribosome-binding factor A
MSHRIERINSVIRQELSNLLQFQVKDPRLGNFISITEVVTSHDLKNATVFISFLCSSEQRREVLEALQQASGFFHKELTKVLRMRRVPELGFQWDDSIERGDHIMRIFDRISSEQPPADS